MQVQLEKELEKEYRAMIHDTGCWCLKLVCAAMTGWPDRTILCPGGRIYFVELKRPGELQAVRKRQLLVHEALRELGFQVLLTDSYQEAMDYHAVFTTTPA